MFPILPDITLFFPDISVFPGYSSFSLIFPFFLAFFLSAFKENRFILGRSQNVSLQEEKRGKKEKLEINANLNHAKIEILGMKG